MKRRKDCPQASHQMLSFVFISEEAFGNSLLELVGVFYRDTKY